MGRIIVFTGKGGVGKTSVAAAHACYSAKEGKKTLIVSTDMAHNLSDIFEMPLGKEVKEVSSCLYALEIDPNYMLEHDFKHIKDIIVKNMISFGMDSGFDQLSVFPGMDELFSLMKIQEIYNSGVYERIIVDCAPTGETLSLLKFPELISWYMEKFFPVGKVAMRILSPISKKMFKVELPDKEAMTDIEKIYLKLTELQMLLKNREVTSIRLVTIPEKMVVEETKRNYMYMNLYNFQVDGIFINRILPKNMDNEFFEDWIKIQSGYINELEEVFNGIPVYYIPWFDQDINGLSGINRLADSVFPGKDVFGIQSDIEGEQYEEKEGSYLLKINLPCVKKEEIHMHQTGTDVIIKIGNFKRNIPIPATLRAYDITSAKLENGTLIIAFTKRV
jgi:arsenite-transporting ATPase